MPHRLKIQGANLLAAMVSIALLAACGNTGGRTASFSPVSSTATRLRATLGREQPGTALVPDRIVVIVMENHSFDDIIGATNASGNRLLAPFLTQAALTNRLATLAFGVTHPSLPNYLSLVAGDSFGVHNDNASCYAVPKVQPCYGFNRKNLVDSLEAANISWNSYNQSMPHDGFLGQQYPNRGDGLYRQKHNPFLYFKDIAGNAQRLTHIKTFVDLTNTLNNSVLPRFSFIVPDECHDMHGAVPLCNVSNSRLIEAGDGEVQRLVLSILNSGSFTKRSLLFITFDEGDDNLGCCDSPPVLAGGHIPLILIAGSPGVVASAHAYNHYSLLATIEAVWNLPKLGYTADTRNVKPMFDLLASD